MVQIAITPKQAEAYADQWRQITDGKAQLDFEGATLAKEIRSHFPNGTSGDLQCRSWMVQNIEITGQTAAMLVRSAKALSAFPKEDDWIQLGGWKSIKLLSDMTRVDRSRVLKEARKVIRERGRIGYQKVRQLAGAKKQARHGRWATEQAFNHVRGWLLTLYDQYELPPMPQHVREAVGEYHVRQHDFQPVR